MRFFFFFFLNLVTHSKAIQLSKSRHVVQEAVSCGVPQQTGYVFHDLQGHVLNRDDVAAGLSDMSESDVEVFLNTADSNADGEFTEDELFATMTDATLPEEKRRATVRMFMTICGGLYNVGATWETDCANGFSGETESSVECQSDGTWTLASGCIVVSSFIEVGSPGEVDCGVPSFTGYFFFRNNDHQLQPSEWPDTFGELTFEVADANEDLIVTTSELSRAFAEVNVDDFLRQYDMDHTVFGSTMEGECGDGFSGVASSISCSAEGVWSEPSGCARQGTGVIEKKSDAFSGIHGRLNTSTTLSPHPLGKIVDWISGEWSKSSASFCYRNSYSRGAGIALTCGLWSTVRHVDQVGLQCYENCGSGRTGVGGTCFEWTDPSCGWSTRHGLQCSGGMRSWARRGGHLVNACSSDRRNEGGLCYRIPMPGYYCGITECHKICDSSLGIVTCGFGGCSSDDLACAQAVIGMITAPMSLVMNAFSFGVGRSFSTSARAVATSVGRINDCLGAGGYMHASANTFVRALQAFINLCKQDLGVITPAHTHASLKDICHVSSLSSGSNGNNACVEQIAELWGARMAAAVAHQANRDDLLAQLEFVDPTGIVGVINAYNKPHCEDANPNYTGPR